MWKAPYRPTASVTQSYNDGIVTIYAARDMAEPGYQPVPALYKKGALRFSRQRIGVQRYYAAKQAQTEIEAVLRVPAGLDISPQDIAILRGGCRQYRIDLVQTVPEASPPSYDLTLVRVEQAICHIEDGTGAAG